MLMASLFNEDVIVPIVVFSIPILAIVGGITSGIVKMLGRQRMIELAQHERIAAIQRGIDPSKLPPLPMEAMRDGDPWESTAAGAKRRAEGLLIGGVVTLFAGVGVAAFLMILRPDTDRAIWAVGIIPIMVGFALLLSAMLVWPRGDSGPPRA